MSSVSGYVRAERALTRWISRYLIHYKLFKMHPFMPFNESYWYWKTQTITNLKHTHLMHLFELVREERGEL